MKHSAHVDTPTASVKQATLKDKGDGLNIHSDEKDEKKVLQGEGQNEI
jgi:hypothetical protein